jgi:hypothetical protein
VCPPQVVVDGAFTKLFCKWDAAGSDRFVRNCAAYLGADMSDRDDDPPSVAALALAASEDAGGPAGAGGALRPGVDLRPLADKMGGNGAASGSSSERAASSSGTGGPGGPGAQPQVCVTCAACASGLQLCTPLMTRD